MMVTVICSVAAHNYIDHRYDLLCYTGGYGCAIRGALGLNHYVRDILLPTGDITSGGTETLGEGPHQKVDIRRIAAKVVENAASSVTNGTDTVRLIQVDIAPVLLLQTYYL